VYEAIRALEHVGVLTWMNRIKRVREDVPGLFGNPVQRRCGSRVAGSASSSLGPWRLADKVARAANGANQTARTTVPATRRNERGAGSPAALRVARALARLADKAEPWADQGRPLSLGLLPLLSDVASGGITASLADH